MWNLRPGKDTETVLSSQPVGLCWQQSSLCSRKILTDGEAETPPRGSSFPPAPRSRAQAQPPLLERPEEDISLPRASVSLRRKARALAAATGPCTVLVASPLPSSPPPFPLAHYVSAVWGASMSFKHTRRAPAPGPLHSLLPLPGTLLPPTLTWLTLHPSGLCSNVSSSERPSLATLLSI